MSTAQNVISIARPPMPVTIDPAVRKAALFLHKHAFDPDIIDNASDADWEKLAEASECESLPDREAVREALDELVNGRKPVATAQEAQPERPAAEPPQQSVPAKGNPEESMSMLERAKAIRITNSIEYIMACEAKLALDEMIKNRHDVHDPVVRAAHETHKRATEARAKDIDPLEEAKRLYTIACERWRQEQERLALEEARRRQEEQRLAAEKEREQELVAAEEDGATVEEVQAIIERPVYVPPVVAQPPLSAPKVSGYRKRPELWKARLDTGNPQAMLQLVQFVAKTPAFVHLLQINESSANALAKGLKTTMQIPGLVAYDANKL